MTEASAKKLTLLELSQLIDTRIVQRCRLMSGRFVGETWLCVEKEDIEGLKQAVSALEYLAPHADTIRRTPQRLRAVAPRCRIELDGRHLKCV